MTLRHKMTHLILFIITNFCANICGNYDKNRFYIISIEFPGIFIPRSDKKAITFFQHMVLIWNFPLSPRDRVKEESSKLRTYALFKTDLGLEPYLLYIKSFEMRSKVTKFRLSNHKLRIETGRRDKIPKQERFCPFCPTDVEDEYHFLFSCPSYQHLRQLYIDPLTSSLNGFETFPAITKIKYLMSATDFKMYNFLSDGMELRTFLISKYKNRD